MLFIGHSIWSSISYLSTLLPKIQSHLKLLNTIAPKFNRKNRFVRRHRLDIHLSELKLLQDDLLSSKQKIEQNLQELYSEGIINEWIALYITPTVNEVEATFADFSAVSNITSWDQRSG